MIKKVFKYVIGTVLYSAVIIALVVSITTYLLGVFIHTQQEYVKFQERMSMDWDSEQEMMLIYNSIYHTGQGATAEEYAYNIIVALNRMLSDDYPDTLEEVCKTDLIYTDVPSEAWEAMEMVKVDKWDETQGDLQWKHTVQDLH